MTTIGKVFFACCAAGALSCSQAAAQYTDTYFFGNSLSDTGNNAYALDRTFPFISSQSLRTPVPIASPDFVATYPYGNDRYSNGPVWAEYFAPRLGGSAQAALQGGTSYAFGGATMGPIGNVLPPSVVGQVASYLISQGNRASPSALYVIEGGGNDARHAADVAIARGDPAPLISAYVNDAVRAVLALESAGAQKILFWNVPDIGKTPEFTVQGPAAATIATGVASAMNRAVAEAIAQFAPDIRRDVVTFDMFGFMGRVIANPSANGLADATSACAYSAACISDPSRTLFWDGLHPTTAGHALLANAAFASVAPEPDLYVLFGIGLAVMAWQRKIKRQPGQRARTTTDS